MAANINLVGYENVCRFWKGLNMKTKIKIVDGEKEFYLEKESRNNLHFDIQRRAKANTFKNKKSYTRKEKHKQRYF